jgi:hypothetical protein
MIAVKMRIDDHAHITGRVPRGFQIAQQSPVSAEPDLATLFVGEFVAITCINKDQAVIGFDEETAQLVGDAVFRIRLHDFLPQDTRDKPERRAAVKPEHAIGEQVKTQSANPKCEGAHRESSD